MKENLRVLLWILVAAALGSLVGSAVGYGLGEYSKARYYNH